MYTRKVRRRIYYDEFRTANENFQNLKFYCKGIYDKAEKNK